MKNRSLFVKIMAIVLAAAMAVTLALPAMAAETHTYASDDDWWWYYGGREQQDHDEERNYDTDLSLEEYLQYAEGILKGTAELVEEQQEKEDAKKENVTKTITEGALRLFGNLSRSAVEKAKGGRQ